MQKIDIILLINFIIAYHLNDKTIQYNTILKIIEFNNSEYSKIPYPHRFFGSI